MFFRFGRWLVVVEVLVSATPTAGAVIYIICCPVNDTQTIISVGSVQTRKFSEKKMFNLPYFSIMCVLFFNPVTFFWKKNQKKIIQIKYAVQNNLWQVVYRRLWFYSLTWSYTETTHTCDLLLSPVLSSHLLSRLCQSCQAVTKNRSIFLSLFCHPLFILTVHLSVIHPSVLPRSLNAPGTTGWPELIIRSPTLCVLVFLFVRVLWYCNTCQAGIFWWRPQRTCTLPDSRFLPALSLQLTVCTRNSHRC